jgi:hypothetical protein
MNCPSEAVVQQIGYLTVIKYISNWITNIQTNMQPSTVITAWKKVKKLSFQLYKSYILLYGRYMFLKCLVRAEHALKTLSELLFHEILSYCCVYNLPKWKTVMVRIVKHDIMVTSYVKSLSRPVHNDFSLVKCCRSELGM